jgi:hypothetical protein
MSIQPHGFSLFLGHFLFLGIFITSDRIINKVFYFNLRESAIKKTHDPPCPRRSCFREKFGQEQFTRMGRTFSVPACIFQLGIARIHYTIPVPIWANRDLFACPNLPQKNAYESPKRLAASITQTEGTAGL